MLLFFCSFFSVIFCFDIKHNELFQSYIPLYFPSDHVLSTWSCCIGVCSTMVVCWLYWNVGAYAGWSKLLNFSKSCKLIRELWYLLSWTSSNMALLSFFFASSFKWPMLLIRLSDFHSVLEWRRNGYYCLLATHFFKTSFYSTASTSVSMSRSNSICLLLLKTWVLTLRKFKAPEAKLKAVVSVEA